MNKRFLLVTIICFLFIVSKGQNIRQCFYYEQTIENKTKIISLLIIINDNKIDANLQEIETTRDFPNNGSQNIKKSEIQGIIEGNEITIKESKQSSLKKEKRWTYHNDYIIIDGIVLNKIICNND